MIGEDLLNEISVEDISLDQSKAGILIRPAKICAISSVGKFVENGETFQIIPFEQLPHQRRANKASTTGDEERSEGAHLSITTK